MSYLDDPRVFFSAERTLLAWQRTAIALIGLGFVVERFGLFMRYITSATQLPPGLRLPLKTGVHSPIVKRQICAAPPTSVARTASG